MKKIFEDIKSGKISVEEAEKLLKLDYLEKIGNSVKYDSSRMMRRNVPEIVYGKGKSLEELIEIGNRIGKTDCVIITKLDSDTIKNLEKKLSNISKINERAGVVIIGKELQGNGKVGIISAGTSDIPIAEEAAMVAEAIGCKVFREYDVGISGLHRIIDAAKKMKEEEIKVVIVVAGMEGALPSITASLMDVPVIGVPTSTGYGYGKNGEAALMGMLNSCTLGLAVMNIDNGVGAAVFASLILKEKSY